MQIRYMETHAPPIRVIVPGTCYRYEATDATHEWMLTQVEGLVIDEGNHIRASEGHAGVVRAPALSGRTWRRAFAATTSPSWSRGAELAIRWRGRALVGDAGRGDGSSGDH